MAQRTKRLTREESKQQTRQLLLDSAAEVFGRRGFNGASVEEVAEEAGFSKGAVYSNFGGKEDLFIALLDRRLSQEAHEWARVFGNRTPTEERVREIESVLLWGAENKVWTMLEMEFFLYAMREEGARRKLAERYRSIRESTEKAVGKHFEEAGADPPLPLGELSWALLGVATGLNIQAYVDPEAVPEGIRAKALAPLLNDAKQSQE